MTVNYEIGRQRADKRMRITILLCVGRSKKRIKTDLFATPSSLNRKGKLRNDTPLYAKVRELMDRTEREYISLDTFLTGESITAGQAVERMKHQDTPSFLSFAEDWLGRQDMKGKKNYKTAVKTFVGFAGDIPFSAFSHRILEGFLLSLKGKSRAQSLYLSAIKKIYTEAEKDYPLPSFASFRIDIPKDGNAKSRALDACTIRRIFRWEGMSRRAVIARDCAILSFCLCGTNSADLFTAQRIRNNTLSYDRQKTKDRRKDNAHIEIEIPEQIKGLVRKYRDSSRAFSFHTIYSTLICEI